MQIKNQNKPGLKKKVGNCAKNLEMVVGKDTENLRKNQKLINNQLIKDTTTIIFKNKKFK